MNWYLDAWKNYVTFTGRSRRKAYWMFVLFNFLAIILVNVVDNGLGLTIIPEMAVKAGLLNGTDVQARPLNAEHASREIALVWRTNSPRREEFELLADALRGLHGN